MPAMRNSIRVAVLALTLAAGCASAKDEAPAPTPAREVITGGARIRGGGMRMDVQVGRPVVHQPVRGGTITVKPAGVVTP